MANKKFECEICNISTTDQTSYDNHILGSKHQLALHTKIVKEKKEKCGVYITGIGNRVPKSNIVDFFSKHGKIVDYFSENDNRFVIIQFEDEKAVKEILQKKLYFYGRLLTIRPRIVKLNNEEKPQQQKEKEDFSTKVVQVLANLPTFDLQLASLIEQIQPPQHTVNWIYQSLCSDLERYLSPTFPFCRAWPFGSTLSGLSFIQSDIDVYIEVKRYPGLLDKTQPLAAEFTKIAKKLMYKSGVFTHIIAIPKAKTPIVKCIHKTTGVSCDLNFKNMLGVCNSRLLSFMLSLDVRLRPMMVIIKFWGKINELTGSGKISNYGLAMLAIFYLQQHPYPILPPVALLQTHESSVFHEGWNGGFCNNPAIVPATYNRATIPELLKGFFDFFSKFDYGFNVICPLSGLSYPKIDFAKPENLPDIFFHYKKMIATVPSLKTDSPLCLQDPFELSHNVTGSMSLKLLEDFQKMCAISAEICTECIKTNSVSLLKKLFEKQTILHSAFANDDTCTFKIPVGTTLAYIEDSIDANIEDRPRLLRQLWFDKINQFLVSVLAKVFLFEILVKKDLPQSKSKKLEGQTDIHDNNTIDTVIFHCTGYSNVWDARKSISKSINFIPNEGNNFLDREIAISDYIVNVLCKGIKITEPLVNFSLKFNAKINPTEAEFVLENIKSRKNSFRQMANFFADRLPVWFDIHMRKSKILKQVDDQTKIDADKKDVPKGESNKIEEIKKG